MATHNPFAVNPCPATSYEEAETRAHAIDDHLEEPLNPVGKTIFMGHGRKVERAIVFFHGLTNCPWQFSLLGQEFYQRGYNVLIPRLPHHGYANRVTMAQGHLRAKELAHAASEAVDIARGMGERITVMGLSGGGSQAAWVTQWRGDVERVVLLAPLIGIANVPDWTIPFLMRLFLLLPDQFHWWNSKLKEEKKPPHAYPGFCMHALFNCVRLGRTVLAAAKHTKPAVPHIQFVTTACDKSVNNRVNDLLAAKWLASGANVGTFRFPREAEIRHDMIDRTNSQQRINVVYPKLLEMAEGG